MLIIQLEDLHFLCVSYYWRLRIWAVLTTLDRKKCVIIDHKSRCRPLAYRYLRVLMSKFRLDGLNSGELCYLYIYGKKTENNENEIECASNLVELE